MLRMTEPTSLFILRPRPRQPLIRRRGRVGRGASSSKCHALDAAGLHRGVSRWLLNWQHLPIPLRSGRKRRLDGVCGPSEGEKWVCWRRLLATSLNYRGTSLAG